MKRFARNLLLGACALAPLSPIVASPAAAAAGKKPPRARLTVACKLGDTAAGREITGYATMRPVSGTKKLRLQFLLQERRNSGGVFATDTTPAISAWISPSDPPSFASDPGYVWRVIQPVDGLYSGFTYRLVVKFRWYGGHHRLIKHEQLHTKGCRVPG